MLKTKSPKPAWARKTHQGQRHSHDDRREDEIEGGDLQHVAVGVWVCVDVLILSRHVQRFGTAILVSVLGDKKEAQQQRDVCPSAVCFASGQQTFTCFRSLKLNSHSASGRVPDTFLTQKSKHCNRKHKATAFHFGTFKVSRSSPKERPSRGDGLRNNRISSTSDLIYLGVEQGRRGGFRQRRDLRHPQVEGCIQMEERADHAGPQTAHPGDGLEVTRQLSVGPVVSERRAGKH